MVKEYLILFCLFVLANGKISIDIETGTNADDVRVNYTGYDIHIITDPEITLFRINQKQLKEAVRRFYKVRPQNVYLKSPTPWNDLYKTNNWEQVKRILTVKSATLKENTKQTTIVLSQDFENLSNVTIKVNTALSQSVENTISTTWSTSNELTVSQEFDYDINVVFGKVAGTTAFSWTSTWGKDEEKSETQTIGATSSIETELKPGQSATAVLSGSKRELEVEIVYSATLRGNVAINFKKPFKSHHFYGPSINSVLDKAGLPTEFNVVENIKVGVFIDHSLKVFDKTSGQPL
ncbi:unnamed protein product [Colias eurytheme]|nr:unnamed protein product [Colias eurytheme]